MSKALYKYVAVIGIDGMGSFNGKTATPEFYRIFKNGAVSYDGISLDPTISAQNWGAMLLGVKPTVHKLTNGIVGRTEYTNELIPSIFKRIRADYPDAYLASFCNWNPINYGIIEHSLGADLQTADNDAQLLEKILPAVAKKPTFLFVQFDDVDGAGHHFGYGTQGHLDKITEIDGFVGKIYDLKGVTEGWKLERVGKVELSILRLAAFEILFDENVPDKVAINEAVEITKKYGGEEAAAFINGVLAKLVKD